MAWQYSEKTKQLFMDAVHGKPGTHMGEIDDPDGFGEHGSIACGDAMRFTFRVKRHPTDPTQDVITDGPLSDLRLHLGHCRLGGPVHADRAGRLHAHPGAAGAEQGHRRVSRRPAAAEDPLLGDGGRGPGIGRLQLGAEARRRPGQLGVDIHTDEQQEGRIVCKCFSLSEPYIRRKIRELNLHSIAEITHAIKAGGACMACHHVPGGLQDLLDETWGKDRPRRPAAAPPALTQISPPGPAEGARKPAVSPYQFSKKIEHAVEEYVRPMLRQDGGDMEIVDIKDMLVYCSLAGRLQGLRRRQPDLPHARRADAQGNGRRAHPRDSGMSSPLPRETRQVLRPTMKIIYADNNATTAVAPEVRQAMAPFFTENYFNPSSMYEPARQTADALRQARSDDRPALRPGDPQQILFTSCATESNNTAIFGAAKANPTRRHIITTAVEHPAVLEVCKELAAQRLRGHLPGRGRARATSTSASSSAPCGPIRCWSASCTPTTRRASSSPSSSSRGWPRRPIRRSSSTPTPRNRWASSRSTCNTACLRRSALVFRPQAARPQGRRRAVHQARHALPAAVDRRASGGRPPRPARKTSPTSSAWPRRWNWPPRIRRRSRRGSAGLRDRLEAALERLIPNVQVNGKAAAAAAQHAEHLLPLHRRRGNALSTQRLRHLRLQRLGLHLRVAGAFARAAGHEGALHGGARLDPFQLQPLQQRGGRGPDH